jgi:hypothetical protein
MLVNWIMDTTRCSRLALLLPGGILSLLGHVSRCRDIRNSPVRFQFSTKTQTRAMQPQPEAILMKIAQHLHNQDTLQVNRKTRIRMNRNQFVK